MNSSEASTGPIIDNAWSAIESWLAKYATEAHQGLRPGASPDELQQFESTTGVRLPSDYRDSLERHDGGLRWDGYEYLAVEHVQKKWLELKAILASGAFADAEVIYAEDRIIQPTWWNEGWIPFAADSGGNLMCLDTAPGENGTSGQVILWEAVEGPSPAGHDSFAAWLDRFMRNLKSGMYELDEQGALVSNY